MCSTDKIICSEEYIMTDDNHDIDHANDSYGREPSNLWIWIILFLLALIILFFVFGGNKLFG